MKTYFGMANPPVNIAKFAIGDGTVGSTVVFEYVPTVGPDPVSNLPLVIDQFFPSYTADDYRDLPATDRLRSSRV